MNKGGYSAPQYRSNDYRSYPGPSRYQPYHPSERFDSRQRSLMHQNDYYPEVNYPRRPDLREELPPFPRGPRGRERDFTGGQSYTPSRPPGPPPPQVPPPLNSPYREYSRMNSHHPPPPFMNGNSSNPLNSPNVPNHPHHTSTPPSSGSSSGASGSPSTPSSHSHHPNPQNHPPSAHSTNLQSNSPHSSNNNVHLSNHPSNPTGHPSNSSSNSSGHPSNGHPLSHPANNNIHHSVHPSHIPGSHPASGNHPPSNQSPNPPSTPNYHTRERPPADYQSMRDYFSPRESPKTPPNYRMVPDMFRPMPRGDYTTVNPVMDELSNLSNNPSPFGMNSPPRNPIHLMPPPQKSPMPPYIVMNPFAPLPMVAPFPPNIGVPDDQKKKIEQTYAEYLKLFEEEKEVEGKKENYEILCHKIESVQAKLDAIASKLSDLEGDKPMSDDV